MRPQRIPNDGPQIAVLLRAIVRRALIKLVETHASRRPQ